MRFLSGKLIYMPDPKSDVGKIEFPIAALSNPLGGEFDLSGCGSIGKHLSINTGYRKGKKAANKGKAEIWLAPRFLIERELSTTAGHFKKIMTAEEWPESAPIGIFWTWGEVDNLELYDYLTNQGPQALSQNDLYRLAKEPRLNYLAYNTALQIFAVVCLAGAREFHVWF